MRFLDSVFDAISAVSGHVPLLALPPLAEVSNILVFYYKDFVTYGETLLLSLLIKILG
jgi:hypothetical protein